MPQVLPSLAKYYIFILHSMYFICFARNVRLTHVMENVSFFFQNACFRCMYVTHLMVYHAINIHERLTYGLKNACLHMFYIFLFSFISYKGYSNFIRWDQKKVFHRGLVLINAGVIVEEGLQSYCKRRNYTEGVVVN